MRPAKDYIEKLRLIHYVRKQRFLWDCNVYGYKDRRMGKAAWRVIGKAIGISGVQCRKKWQSIRSTYKKELELQMLGKQSRWPLMEHMDFLKSLIQRQIDREYNKYESYQQGYTDEGKEVIEIDTEENNPDWREMNSKGNGDESDLSANVSTGSTLNQVSDKDHEDYHFLMSILPSMKALPQQKKNDVRMKILYIIEQVGNNCI